jgi:hypothetical protein
MNHREKLARIQELSAKIDDHLHWFESGMQVIPDGYEVKKKPGLIKRVVKGGLLLAGGAAVAGGVARQIAHSRPGLLKKPLGQTAARMKRTGIESGF